MDIIAPQVMVGGQMKLSGADIQAKNSDIRGINVHLGAEKTVNLREHSKNQSKGSWYRKESNRVETTHRTTIVGDSVNIEASKGKVTTEGAKISAKMTALYGEEGVNLKGVTSTSEQLNLNAGKGNLVLTAATDSVNKTDVSVGLKLGGGVAEQKWTPSSGSGHLAVNVVRNETHTETTLNTDTAKINAGGDAKFIGGSVNANHASGTISGDSHSEQLANKVNEVSVSLAANGSGKLAVPTTDKWAEAAKNDWNNGSIAGVKADAKLEVNAKHQQTATNAGVNATQDTVVVKGVKSRTEMKNHRSRQIYFKAEATTAIKKQVDAKIPEKVRQVVKPIRAVNLQLIKNNKVNYKVRVRH